MSKQRVIAMMVLLLGCVGFAIGTPATAIPGGLATVIAGVWILKNKHATRNRFALESVLPQIDVIIGGRRFIGTESEMITSRRWDDPAEAKTPLDIEQLCRTNNGAWFSVRFQTRSGSGRTQNVKVTPLDEDQARTWLEQTNDSALYERFFGEAVIA